MKRFTDKLALCIIWFAVLTFPIFAHAGGLGIAISGTLLGIGGLFTFLSKGGAAWRGLWPLSPYWIWVFPFLGFLIWANISAVWNPQFTPSFSDAHKILIMGGLLIFSPLILAALRHTDRMYLRHALMAMSLAAVAVMVADIASGWGLSLFIDPVGADENLSRRQSDAMMNLGHGLYSYMQYLAPLFILYLSFLSKPWPWIAAIGFGALIILGSWLNLLNIGIIGVAIVVFTMLIAMFLPKFTLISSLLLFTALIILAPVIGILSNWLISAEVLSLGPSWDHRLHMWAYTWEQIQTQPIMGHGFDAARTFEDTYPSKYGYHVALISLHPHNIGLHIWLETGFIGAALISLSLLALIKPSLRYANTVGKAMALSGFIIATALIGATTIGVWQFWWWGVIAFGVLILGLLDRKQLKKL